MYSTYPAELHAARDAKILNKIHFIKKYFHSPIAIRQLIQNTAIVYRIHLKSVSSNGI